MQAQSPSEIGGRPCRARKAWTWRTTSRPTVLSLSIGHRTHSKVRRSGKPRSRLLGPSSSLDRSETGNRVVDLLLELGQGGLAHGADGPCYQWTRKVKGKTVSVALSQEQYQALQQAIENWRDLQKILQRMQALSRQVVFATLPNPPRRKRLSKKVLGLF